MKEENQTILERDLRDPRRCKALFEEKMQAMRRKKLHSFL